MWVLQRTCSPHGRNRGVGRHERIALPGSNSFELRPTSADAASLLSFTAIASGECFDGIAIATSGRYPDDSNATGAAVPMLRRIGWQGERSSVVVTRVLALLFACATLRGCGARRHRLGGALGAERRDFRRA
jgi:hypothetical protein